MISNEVKESLKKISADIEKFHKLIGLELVDTDSWTYVCRNRDQVDEEFCKEDLIDYTVTAYNEIQEFLNMKGE